MRKAFTKFMVKAIEEKFHVTLTEEQITAGKVKLEYTRGYIGASVIEVEIFRDAFGIDNKHISVTANFKGDSYKWLNAYVENAKLKTALSRI